MPIRPPRSQGGAKVKPPPFVAPQLATLVKKPPAGDGVAARDQVRRLPGDRRDRRRPRAHLHALGPGLDREVCPIARALRRARREKRAARRRDRRARRERPQQLRATAARPQGRQGARSPTTSSTCSSSTGAICARSRCAERKERLAQDARRRSRSGIRYSDHVVGHGEKVLRQGLRLGLEGIVSKRADKPYQSRRTKSWLKMQMHRATTSSSSAASAFPTRRTAPFASLAAGRVCRQGAALPRPRRNRVR